MRVFSYGSHEYREKGQKKKNGNRGHRYVDGLGIQFYHKWVLSYGYVNNCYIVGFCLTICSLMAFVPFSFIYCKVGHVCVVCLVISINI